MAASHQCCAVEPSLDGTSCALCELACLRLYRISCCIRERLSATQLQQPYVPRAMPQVQAAWRQLLEAAALQPTLQSHGTFQYDVVDVGRQVL